MARGKRHCKYARHACLDFFGIDISFHQEHSSERWLSLLMAETCDRNGQKHKDV